MATTIAVMNETESSSSRMTKDGRKITYRMRVIQQPERARACGSGAKSSADRRPVDPPPIVELRVFDGEAATNDITFAYNANFFLFATLETARTMAQGRVAPQASFPVLTGTPVAGMAYLDRPSQAGYFIFPDLSVRHEGKYRLSFALYEELKEAKDMDHEDRQERGQTDTHVSHRLEVKSRVFHVYSAKKFPGLSESTALSRMVAEQGCRVRIRRDVRMRRRDNKSKDEWDDYEDQTAARRTATPDAYGQSATTPQAMPDGPDRPRSQSNASNVTYATPARRTSMQEMAQNYQSGYQGQMAPPQPPQNAYNSQISYGAPAAPQYQSQYAAQQPSMMQPPQAPYMAQHSGYHQQQQQPSMMPQAYGYHQYSQQQQPQQPQQHYEQQPHVPSEYRRASMAAQPQPQQYPSSQLSAPAPFGNLDTGYQRQSMSQPGQTTSHHNGPAQTNGHSNGYLPLAPLKTLQPPAEKLEPISPSYPMSASGVSMPEPQPPRAYPDSKVFGNGSLSASTKRSFSATFDTHHIEQPLRQGARPSISHSAEEPSAPSFGADAANDEDSILDGRAMSYRRADGTHRSRRVPLSN
ncbi:hypothetical protein K490DRAFT_75664 [Saccharata proteae CBS 121410]|uniref:Velvet domain-containing protein n=1 Tax=Saccharata proteae CBS 121410 TaxID=1314787 RepID=A0A9P4HN47_9PEZI|nr:hypothetical protein K490DRAFT_75664 [Saccharata proteae CBS 121410]